MIFRFFKHAYIGQFLTCPTLSIDRNPVFLGEGGGGLGVGGGEGGEGVGVGRGRCLIIVHIENNSEVEKSVKHQYWLLTCSE